MKTEFLGGKTALGLSKVVADEQAKFREYRDAILELIPINTNEKAHKLRTVTAKFMPELKKDFKELNLSYDE